MTMPRSHLPAYVGVALSLLLPIVGCAGPKTYPVEGRVVFKDGKPMTEGSVSFEPVDPAVKVCARGDIQPDGSFRLGTYKPGDGAPPGKYRVGVFPPLSAEGDETRPQPRVIHSRFQDFEESKLEYTVTSGKNAPRLEVERP